MFDRDFPQIKQQPTFHQPQSHRTLSDFKPPTLDSSFIQNAQSKDQGIRQSFSKEPVLLCNIQDAREKVQQINCLIEDQISQRIDKYQCSSAKQLLIQPQLTTKALHLSRQVKQFINTLMKQAYIYREKNFNAFQKNILTERYLEQESPICGKNIIYFQFIWDLLFTLSVIIVLLIYIPLQLGFSLDNNTTYGVILVILIIIDLGTSFYQTYKIQNRFQITQKTLIDILYLLSNTAIQSMLYGQFIVIALLISFVCGLIKFQQKVEEQQIFIAFNIHSCLKIVQLLLIIHFCTCMWILIGNLDDKSWINILNIQEETNLYKYCHSLYWSTASLLSIGSSMQLHTEAELMFSSFIMFLSCWIFSYILFIANGLFNENQEQEQHIRKQLKIANKFLQVRNLSTGIKSKIRSNIKYNQPNDSDQSQLQQIVINLPQKVKEALQIELRVKALSNCSFLKYFSEYTLKQLVDIMEYRFYDSNQIITQDEQSFYLIEFGQIQVLEYDKVISTLQNGDFFGELHFFSGETGTTKFRISQKSYLYKIKSIDFQKIISTNKLDFERYMFIKDSLKNQRYKILGHSCNSCNSDKHLIKDCPLINYKPNLITLIKKAQAGEVQRNQFNRDRNINRRMNNQIFNRMIINQNMIDLIRMKLKIQLKEDVTEEYLSEEDEETDKVLDQLTDQMQSNISYNKPNEIKKDGNTIQSQLKSIDQVIELSKPSEEWSEQPIQLRQNTIQGTFGTAQFQHDQQYQQSIPQAQKQFKYGFSLTPFDFTVQTNSLSQLEQYSQSCLSNEGLNQVMKTQKRPSFQIKQKQSPPNVPVESIKVNLSKIHEEDSSIIMAKKQEDQGHSLPTRNSKYSLNSMKSKNTPTNQQSRQSSRKFSSKLSSIQFVSSENINHKPSKFSQQTKSNLILPVAQEIVDLSNYQSYENKSEEFETMHLFTIYFPFSNYDLVIQRVNYCLKWKSKQHIRK